MNAEEMCVNSTGTEMEAILKEERCWKLLSLQGFREDRITELCKKKKKKKKKQPTKTYSSEDSEKQNDFRS